MAKNSVLEETLLLQIKLFRLPEPVREYKFIDGRKFRADFAWPDIKLIVECEGGTYIRGRHVRPKGFESDCEKYNLATIQGWRVLRFTADMINHGIAINMIESIFE